MKKNLVIGLACTLVFFSSCVSKPKFEGKGDLCGLIIDENNHPVKDFVVVCNARGVSAQVIKPVATNESGLFVFYDLPSGTYSISGEKNNYMGLSGTDYRFDDRTKIICLQVKTFKAAIENAEELIRLGEKKEAIKILDSISCERKSNEALIIQAYRFFTAESDKERKSAAEKFKKSVRNGPVIMTDYSQKLLEVVK